MHFMWMHFQANEAVIAKWEAFIVLEENETDIFLN